jgi:hypothetical protein
LENTTYVGVDIEKGAYATRNIASQRCNVLSNCIGFQVQEGGPGTTSTYPIFVWFKSSRGPASSVVSNGLEFYYKKTSSGINTSNILTDNLQLEQKLCINDKCIDRDWINDMSNKVEDMYKKTATNRKTAGFSIDGEGSSIALYEGAWNLFDGQQFDAWTNNRWDLIYIFRGWRITVWENGIGSGSTNQGQNTTSDVPLKWDISDNYVSSYLAEYIGY